MPLVRFILWLSVLFLAGLLPRTTYATSSSVVISELMWMGSGVSSADEWIELVNTADQSVDVSGWVFMKGDTVMLTIPDESTIGAGEYFLISNYGEQNSVLLVEPDLVTTKVSLPNSGLYISLRTASGDLVDIVDDGVGAPFAGRNVAPKASMERIDLFSSGTDSSNWQTAISSQNFDEGVEIFGSPGTHNDIILPAPAPAPAPTPALIISELLPNPKGSDDHEWIEILNKGEDTTLDNVSLRKSSSEYFFDPSVKVKSGNVVLVKKHVTGISLSSEGGVVELLYQGHVIDSMEYPKLQEEVSYGVLSLTQHQTLTPFCIPTPGKPNTIKTFDARINLQSSEQRGDSPHPFNVEAEVTGGSINAATCRWDYGDGTIVKKCNPASHTFEEPGMYEVKLEVRNACGEIVEKKVGVLVEDSSNLQPGFSTPNPNNLQPGFSTPDSVMGGEKIESSSEPKDPQGSLRDIWEHVAQHSSGSLGLEVGQGKGQGQGQGMESGCDTSVGTGVIVSSLVSNPQPGASNPSTSSGQAQEPGTEFIELTNTSSQPFCLHGWFLDDIRDGGSKAHVIGDIVLEGGESRKFFQDETKLKLNNSGDEVWLVSPDGSVEIGVEFGKLGKGEVCKVGMGDREWGIGIGFCLSSVVSSAPSFPIPNPPSPIPSFLQSIHQNIQESSNFSFVPRARAYSLFFEQKMYTKNDREEVVEKPSQWPNFVPSAIFVGVFAILFYFFYSKFRKHNL